MCSRWRAIAVVILGLGVAVLVAGVTGVACPMRTRCLRVTKARVEIENLTWALGAYREGAGRLPGADEGLEALRVADDERGGPYFKKDIPRDPWGRRYVYRLSPQRDVFAVYSVGINGIDELSDGDDVVYGPKPYSCREYGVGCWPPCRVLEVTALVGVLGATTALVASSFVVVATWLALRLGLDRRSVS